MKRDMQRNSRSEVACAFPQVPLVKGRRCVVLADGFYEWQRRQATNHRQPYFIYFPQVKPEKVAAAACPLWLSGFLDVRLGVFPIFFFLILSHKLSIQMFLLSHYFFFLGFSLYMC